MHRIHKSIDIDFAHHVRGHAGACINLHGHTWKFEVGVQAESLDARGFVIDFSDLKQKILTPCHQLLDHSLAVGTETYAEIADQLEPLGRSLLRSRDSGSPESEPTTLHLHGAKNHWPGGLKVAVFPFAITSERLARWLFEFADSAIADDRVSIHVARIYETLHPVEAVAEYVP